METPTKNPAAVALGRMGGSVTSTAKAAAARANGAKGGRPRKSPAAVPAAPVTPAAAVYAIEKEWDGNESTRDGRNGRMYTSSGRWRWVVLVNGAVESVHDLKREARARVDRLRQVHPPTPTPRAPRRVTTPRAPRTTIICGKCEREWSADTTPARTCPECGNDGEYEAHAVRVALLIASEPEKA